MVGTCEERMEDNKFQKSFSNMMQQVKHPGRPQMRWKDQFLI
jgi:hypothetical protein